MKMNEYYYIILHKQFVYCNQREREREGVGERKTLEGCLVSIDLERVDIMQAIQATFLLKSGSDSGLAFVNIQAGSQVKGEKLAGLTAEVLVFQFSPLQTVIPFTW